MQLISIETPGLYPRSIGISIMEDGPGICIKHVSWRITAHITLWKPLLNPTHNTYSLSNHWKEDMKDRQNRYFLCLQNSAELGKDIGLESVFKDTIYGQLKQFKDLGKSQTHTHTCGFLLIFFYFFYWAQELQTVPLKWSFSSPSLTLTRSSTVCLYLFHSYISWKFSFNKMLHFSRKSLEELLVWFYHKPLKLICHIHSTQKYKVKDRYAQGFNKRKKSTSSALF